ncbi:Gfo/Idh/MocA family oxidoreductase [Rhodobacterales bacterium HKCCE2091]|nr:Gfo/Idh/MocA family oxidoreductase [Rhodobacterales bacterium HKCCE2091]
MTIGVGLIGSGYMGKTHAMAYRSAGAIMGDVPDVRLVALADATAEQASEQAAQFGFERGTGDWRDLLSDPAIDLVSVATPNSLHRDMAVAALEAGKHVWCEKPMALTLADAEAMEAAARASGRITMMGYNYVHNPAVQHARRIVASGRIGRVVHVRGWFDEDYQADPDLPWTWRARIADAGLGVLGDMGCHIVALVEAVAGPIVSVVAETQVIHETRPLPDGTGLAAVENEDVATALVTFDNGAKGSISTSRSAWGRKNRLDFEIHGTRGMILFEQERMNELRVFVNEGKRDEQGFRTILSGPDHPPFGRFVPGQGHQIGFLDLKTIEAAELLRAIASGSRPRPDFTDGLHIERVIHAIADSANAGGARREVG